jgi:hypothetical protein
MFILDSELFQETEFNNEAELEAIVEKYAKLLFGNDTIYLSKKMLVRTGEGRGTIPDAFVIDYENEQWYIVEAELIAHGVWRHIVPQITSQIVACLNEDTRNLLTDRVLEHIASDARLRLEPHIQQRVVKILRKEPVVAIPIDSSSDDLEAWAQTQKLPVSIWVISKLESLTDPGRIAYQIPSDSEASIVAQPTQTSISVVRRASAKNVAALIEGGLIRDGEELSLSYQGKHFSGRASPQGIMLDDGKIYSPSLAAIKCYARVGATRLTENGWRVWKNNVGRTLNELFDQLRARKEVMGAEGTTHIKTTGEPM